MEALYDVAWGGLAGDEEIDCSDGDGEDRGDQSLEKESAREGEVKGEEPEARAALGAIEQAEEGPECEGDRQGESGIGDENAGEEEDPDAGREDGAGVEAGAAAKRPHGKARGDPAKSDVDESEREARGPVVDAEDAEGGGHDPVDERRFLEIGDAVEPGGNPVAALQHVAGDLRLDGVDIVHEVRRADDQWQEHAAGDEEHKKIYTETVEKFSSA